MRGIDRSTELSGRETEVLQLARETIDEIVERADGVPLFVEELTDGGIDWVMNLGNVYERLPFFTKGTRPEKIHATDVYLFTSSKLEAKDLTLMQNNNGHTFTGGQDVGTMHSFVANHDVVPLSDWKLTIKNVTTQFDELWLAARLRIKQMIHCRLARYRTYRPRPRSDR